MQNLTPDKLDRMRVRYGARRAKRITERFPQRATLQTELPTAPELKQLGTSGVLKDKSGLPIYDVSPDMQPVEARGLFDEHGIYHEMSRGNPSIAGVLALLSRTISRSHYSLAFDPGENEEAESPEEEAELAFTRRLLGMDGTPGWLVGGLRRFLEQGCHSFRYGFVPFELTWALQEWEGRPIWVPSRVTRIAPWSVKKWLWQGETLVGLTQVQEERVSDYFSREKSVTIPASKLLLFTHEHVDGNPEGTSMLRPCWLAWEAWKGTFIRFQEAEERQFGGLTKFGPKTTNDGQVYECSSDEDVETFKEIAELAANGELGWVQVAAGWEFDKSHPEYSIPSRVDYLAYCDRQIFLTLSAVLLGLDASNAASAKLSGDLGQLLRQSLQAAAGEVCDVINGLHGVETTGLIRRAIDANFAPRAGRRYPQLVPAGIDQSSMQGFADAFTKLSQFQAVCPTVEDELEIRRRFGLPYIPRETLAEIRARLPGGQMSQSGTQAPVNPPATEAQP